MFLCSDCAFEETSIVDMKQYFLQKQGLISVNHSWYSNLNFGENIKNLDDIENFQKLPVKIAPRSDENNETLNGYQQTEIASSRDSQTYVLKKYIIRFFWTLCEEQLQTRNLPEKKLAMIQKMFS